MKEYINISFKNLGDFARTTAFYYLIPSNRKEWHGYVLVSHLWYVYFSADFLWKNYLELKLTGDYPEEKFVEIFFRRPQCRQLKYLSCDYIGRQFVLNRTESLMQERIPTTPAQKELLKENSSLKILIFYGILSLENIDRMGSYTILLLDSLAEALNCIVQISIKDKTDTLSIHQMRNVVTAISKFKSIKSSLTYCHFDEKETIINLIDNKLSWFESYKKSKPLDDIQILNTI